MLISPAPALSLTVPPLPAPLAETSSSDFAPISMSPWLAVNSMRPPGTATCLPPNTSRLAATSTTAPSRIFTPPLARLASSTRPAGSTILPAKSMSSALTVRRPPKEVESTRLSAPGTARNTACAASSARLAPLAVLRRAARSVMSPAVTRLARPTPSTCCSAFSIRSAKPCTANAPRPILNSRAFKLSEEPAALPIPLTLPSLRALGFDNTMVSALSDTVSCKLS